MNQCLRRKATTYWQPRKKRRQRHVEITRQKRKPARRGSAAGLGRHLLNKRKRKEGRKLSHVCLCLWKWPPFLWREKQAEGKSSSVGNNRASIRPLISVSQNEHVTLSLAVVNALCSEGKQLEIIIISYWWQTDRRAMPLWKRHDMVKHMAVKA